jgi:hypothetical protein
MVYMSLPVKAWAIKDRKTGDIVIFDARCPVYWLKRVAEADAKARGLDAEIVRVAIKTVKR